MLDESTDGSLSRNVRPYSQPPTMARDRKIISFGIAENLSHARWRNILRELSIWEGKPKRNYKRTEESDENRDYWSG
jgi:hypothetical protein